MSCEAKDFFIFGISVKDIVPVVIGAIVGGIIGFGSSFGISLINNRNQKEKEEKEKALNIIMDVVRFIVKTHRKANDIVINMNDFHNRMSTDKKWYEKTDAVRAEKEKIEYLDKLEDKSGDFYEEYNIIGIQVKRLGDYNIYKKFDNLMKVYNKFYMAIFEAKISAVKKEHLQFEKLSNKFINLCIKISKIDAPIRTPRAPGKKKGLAENG